MTRGHALHQVAVPAIAGEPYGHAPEPVPARQSNQGRTLEGKQEASPLYMFMPSAFVIMQRQASCKEILPRAVAVWLALATDFIG